MSKFLSASKYRIRRILVIVAVTILAMLIAYGSYQFYKWYNKSVLLEQEEEYMRSHYYNYVVTENTVSELEAPYVGLWQYGDRATGSGYTDLYLLLQDNTFVYKQSQYRPGERLRYLYGNWMIKDDAIQFSVKCKAVIEGGIEVPVPEYESEIQGGHMAFHFYKPNDFETVIYPLQSIEYDNNMEADHIAIGDDEYFAMTHNVDKNGRTPYWMDPYREGMLFRFREICQMYGYDEFVK